MNNLHNTTQEDFGEVESELKTLVDLMIKLLAQQKQHGRLREEEYNNLVENKIKFLS